MLSFKYVKSFCFIIIIKKLIPVNEIIKSGIAGPKIISGGIRHIKKDIKLSKLYFILFINIVLI